MKLLLQKIVRLNLNFVLMNLQLELFDLLFEKILQQMLLNLLLTELLVVQLKHQLELVKLLSEQLMHQIVMFVQLDLNFVQNFLQLMLKRPPQLLMLLKIVLIVMHLLLM